MITSEGRDGQLARHAGTGPAAVLSRFRRDFHACLTARADELCELADAVLCADGPVRNLAALSPAPEHRRRHGALYDAVSHGRIISRGCGGRWPGCRYRGPRMGGRCWRQM